MKQLFEQLFSEGKILIIGFGVEGQSSYRFIRKHFPTVPLAIADRNLASAPEDLKNDPNLTLYTGSNYLAEIGSYQVLMKSPGIRTSELASMNSQAIITSQTDLFLAAHRNRIIGITGTKGKTTTSHLVYHILKHAGCDVRLAGNMGMPPFEIWESLAESTWVVFEISSHQLEHVNHSPHISLLLNIFQEHLDHYDSYRSYQLAKFNIARFQTPSDYFIYHAHNQQINSLIDEFGIASKQISFSLTSDPLTGIYIKNSQVVFNIPGQESIVYIPEIKLVGEHNMLNILAAFAIGKLLGISEKNMTEAISTFNPLPHRLEFVGEYRQKVFYNDSIATIPEAAIHAVNALNDIDVLILGGFDRGIDYREFAAFLVQKKIPHLVFTGDAGKRMLILIKEHQNVESECQFFPIFDDAVAYAISATRTGYKCLLSPAASSYDQFRNFEHRGNRFKELITKWASSG